MSWVAAYLTLRDRRWLRERELFRDDRWRVPVIWSSEYRTHRPDLVASVNDGVRSFGRREGARRAARRLPSLSDDAPTPEGRENRPAIPEDASILRRSSGHIRDTVDPDRTS
jgi:hypothetical protein